MKIVNINLSFYPDSIGGAAVVAEKLAWGLVQAGHEVNSIYLSRQPVDSDFTVMETPFGRSIAINNVTQSPATRFFNPVVTSLLKELIDLLNPDLIFVHAVQHMGIHELLADPDLRSRCCIVAHDFFWTCLQGFRNLPDGQPCNLAPNGQNCRQCAWFPGLTDGIYAASRTILNDCRAVVFPSHYLYAEYVRLLGEGAGNFVVQSNPDIAETIITDQTVLPDAPGAEAKARGKTVFGFVGGPGETKGWGLVRDFMQRAKDCAADPGGPHVVLYDIGRSINVPWYPGMKQPGTTITDPFHWSFGRHALSQLDVLLMPSRVRESFGLAAREILSMDRDCIIRPSGALAEIQDCAGVAVAEQDDDVDSLMAKLKDSRRSERRPWPGTSISDYVAKLTSL
ncbi:glycosyltransferase [Paracoccus sp. M683]|uniref:glycosyltransferase n=1 Tax=Paracoccus sp. M683 TaxID=2594268 RepID=UPI00117F0641|nr:glycosyltransferase [Paracoccus sp. M683]TRW98708.1 glycosyltransferase [Paracoccus sp. M683]